MKIEEAMRLNQPFQRPGWGPFVLYGYAMTPGSDPKTVFRITRPGVMAFVNKDSEPTSEGEVFVHAPLQIAYVPTEEDLSADDWLSLSK